MADVRIGLVVGIFPNAASALRGTSGWPCSAMSTWGRWRPSTGAPEDLEAPALEARRR